MTYDNYIKCAAGSSLPTGEIEIFYNFSSGSDDDNIGDFIFNLKYPTGDHWSWGTTQHGAAGEFVHADLFPGFVIGETDNPISNQGKFDGADLIQVGENVNYSGWSAILDITPNLCDYTTENNLSRILFSTMDHHASTSGFFIGISQSNKPYIQYNEGANSLAKTVNKEIDKNSIIAVTQAEDSISLAVYNLETEEVIAESLDTNAHPRSSKMYLGNFKSDNYPDLAVGYTGYEGNMNYFSLFNSPFSNDDLVPSCRCMFSTGINVTTEVTEYVAPTITGFEDVTVYTTGITGYETNYKRIADPANQQNPTAFINVAYQSGVTGLIESGVVTNFLTGDPVISSATGYLTGAIYDQPKLDLYNRYFLNFKNGLGSGEHVEIFSFEEPRFDNQLTLDDENKVSSSGIRLYNYGLYNQSINDPTYMTEGIRGESGARIAAVGAGHDYDYQVLSDMTLSGFPTENQRIIYDQIDTNAICIDFSGYWSHKTDAQAAVWGLTPNRVGTGQGYFPSSPQFFNETDPQNGPRRDFGQVVITGISGQKIWENNHIYYNGQKLIENIDFFTGHIETGNSLSIDALVITGGIPGVSIYGNSYDSIVNTPDSFYTPEMCFVPMVTGEKPEIIRKDIQPCTRDPYCSDSQHTTKETCEAPGTCSNTLYNASKSLCESQGGTWTSTNTWINTYENKALCESKGGSWAPFDGISDPISGFSEMIWLNGIRITRDEDYRKGKECSPTKAFTFFGENPFIFYNNSEDFLNLG